MIIVRNIFRLKFGKAREAKAIAPEFVSLNKKHGVKYTRVLTDITGPSYTMVFETGHDSLADFESKLNTVFGAPEWGAMYAKFTPLVESSYREILNVAAE